MQAAIVLGLFLLTPGVLSSLATSTVHIKSGELEGQPANNAGIKAFLGIPFAAPPVGNLRWQSPQPAPAFSGVRNATAFGASCYSAAPAFPQGGPVSEDCLFANVWTGAVSTIEVRPVMVWLYGGGFQFGSSSVSLYKGSNLAEHGVIVVSFNYRLGVFGFLGLDKLDQQGTPSGNYGLQDQLAALLWVKENIAAFGGDPENVTIFGQSAGAHSIGILLASPLSTGLFNKAILQSGAYWDSEHGSLRTFVEARAQGAAFQMKLGASSLAQLRTLTAQSVNSAGSWNASTDPGLTAFAPSIDGYVIPTVPAETFNVGKSQKVPLLVGFNAAEGLAFLPRIVPHVPNAQYDQSAKTLFGPTTPAFMSLYPGDTQAQANESALGLLSDLVIREQTFEAIDRQANVNRQDVYAYYYTYTSAYSPVAVHTAEIYYVFGNLGPDPLLGPTGAPTAADVDFSITMSAYWTNFAKTGNPNNASAGLPSWPKYSLPSDAFLELGNNIRAISNPFSARFHYLSRLRVNGVLPPSWRHEFTNN
ncbi:hypothetical protein LTR35_018009 [Friedmanniomyces endolithicus]|uniref:Carboxylic ester hydrolase n=1 Tax=Friedmanniomyces endolithicus TaxID=329885 RepID=A0AAN6J3J8_9PEZI|nr:hypothetical protein LTR35_018009 [Friedmanniomyces endolithicus]KAK0266968.1 hypothetical protein LTS00_017900 [Friedmanniomyces endolithicus]KAK0301609.1 hypothetical protein LTR82_018214 [Friedmanniomyces endolithicus]KAK0969691.1 hypothetical protein LTR54_018069 [Friedmanniomyces endolithicus]